MYKNNSPEYSYVLVYKDNIKIKDMTTYLNIWVPSSYKVKRFTTSNLAVFHVNNIYRASNNVAKCCLVNNRKSITVNF